MRPPSAVGVTHGDAATGAGPMTDLDTRRPYPRFLDLARGLAGDRRYEAAYHALMAAVHCAEDDSDADQLAEAAVLLRNYRLDIDAIRPSHRLSTQSTHGGRSIYEMGAVMAEAMIKRLESQDRIAELRDEMSPRPPRP